MVRKVFSRQLQIILIIISFISIKTIIAQEIVINTNDFAFSINKSGLVDFSKLDNTNNMKEKSYMLKEENSYLLSLKRFDSEVAENPKKVTWKTIENGIVIKLKFLKNYAKVKIINKNDYITAELIELSKKTDIEKIIWGPYNLTISDKIGKSLGVLYNNDFAIGLMGLNLKSRGGFEIEHRERYGNAATRLNKGGVLQGFTKNRTNDFVENSCLQEMTNAKALYDEDANLIGSKFAIYGTKTIRLLELISKIETTEQLPHPVHENQWIKTSPYATSCKFIMSFNSRNIDDCLDIAEKAGVSCVYHPGIFDSWGTYSVKTKDFPLGYKSVLECSNKAKERHISLGAHTLSNFITKNDPMVSPTPSSNLQLAGITTLKMDISENDTEILLTDNHVRIAYNKDNLEGVDNKVKFNENKNRESFAVLVDKEIIEYSTVTQNGELILESCKRGAFGTQSTTHKAGTPVGRLVSHYYKVFFPNILLQDTVAKNLAHFFNKTKLERISFDGVEGGLAAGHGRYGSERFIKVFFDHLDNKNIIANSSDLMHYSWHYFANESWGEPWWAKSFRESQLDHRLKVQNELKEELIPRKMGQFSIGAKTTLKDIQWVMGLCAGYDSGVDFYVSPNSIAKNPQGEQILYEIKKWETARLNQLFSDKQKETLRDPFSLYGLELENNLPKLVFIESWVPSTGKIQDSEDRNTLPKGIFEATEKAFVSLDYNHINKQKEPGQPTFSEWKYYCSGSKQKLQFVIRLPKSSKTSIKNTYFKIGANTYTIPFTITPGDYVISKENGQLIHFSETGKELNSVKTSNLWVSKGENTILFDYKNIGEEAGPKVIVNFRTYK